MMAEQDIEALLGTIEAAVKRADLTAMIAAAPMLEAALQGFEPAASLDRSRRLSDHASRLTLHLEAARRGLQSAKRRLSDIRAACDLRTYDRQGQTQNLLGGPAPSTRRF